MASGRYIKDCGTQCTCNIFASEGPARRRSSRSAEKSRLRGMMLSESSATIADAVSSPSADSAPAPLPPWPSYPLIPPQRSWSETSPPSAPQSTASTPSMPSTAPSPTAPRYRPTFPMRNSAHALAPSPRGPWHPTPLSDTQRAA